ncbi:MAG: hypothetical protein II712_02620, partial [Erysipelotrichaceae bacterium]|nr:hypothetical protein [Erysipelotrichaceae bacterium]
MAARRRKTKKKAPLEIPDSWVKSEDDDTEYEFPTAECDKCRCEVPFLVHKTRRYGSINGVRYRYKGKKANCSICGNTVYLPEIIQYNLRKLIEESKKEKYKEKENG